MKFDHILSCFLACSSCFFAGTGHAAVDQKENSCVRCHAALPGSSFVGARSHDWRGSVHQKHGVTCDKCHGGNPRVSGEKEAHQGVLGSNNPESSVFYKNIPSTCGKCHGAEFYKFKQSRHYKILESTGKGAECVTCHGSMVTTVLKPDTVEAVCERCHNERLGVFPDVPKKAKTVLLLLRETIDLLEADKKIYGPGETARRREVCTTQRRPFTPRSSIGTRSIWTLFPQNCRTRTILSRSRPGENRINSGNEHPLISSCLRARPG